MGDGYGAAFSAQYLRVIVAKNPTRKNPMICAELEDMNNLEKRSSSSFANNRELLISGVESTKCKTIQCWYILLE